MSTEFIRIKNSIYRRDSIIGVCCDNSLYISISHAYLDKAVCDTIRFDSKEEAEKEFEKVSKLLLIETKSSQSNSSASSTNNSKNN